MTDTTPEVDRPEANHELLPWVIFQIGSDRALAYRFVIARQGADVPLEQDEYVDTTADADGWLGGSVKVLETRASFREWEPIAGAPKDDWQIVARIKNGQIEFWHKAQWGSRGWMTITSWSCDPTHYLPLPDPPQGHKGTE